MNILSAYANDISSLCEAHNVKSLYAFGSVLTDKFDKDGDIDLIVDFADVKIEDYADNYFDFKFSLEDILKRPIDLLEGSALKNPYFIDAVNQQRQIVYGQQNFAHSNESNAHHPLNYLNF